MELMEPINALTEKPYSGKNVQTLLEAQSFGSWPSSAWLTFKQARAAGGTVNKGERGFRIVRVVMRKDKETGEEVRVLKQYCVFNVAQCRNLVELDCRAQDVEAERLAVADVVPF